MYDADVWLQSADTPFALSRFGGSTVSTVRPGSTLPQVLLNRGTDSRLDSAAATTERVDPLLTRQPTSLPRL